MICFFLCYIQNNSTVTLFHIFCFFMSTSQVFFKKTWQSGKLTYCWWLRNPAPFGSIWDVSNLVNNGISATNLRIYCCPANSGFVGSPELRPPFGHLGTRKWWGTNSIKDTFFFCGENWDIEHHKKLWNSIYIYIFMYNICIEHWYTIYIYIIHIYICICTFDSCWV